MDKQAFDLMMKRFDNIDASVDDVKRLCGSLDDRCTSLEETRTRHRTVMASGGVLVTFFSTVFSWLAAK